MAHGGHSVTGIPLLDEDITTPEEMQAMARVLRGQQLAGTLLSTMGAGPKAAPMIGQQITQGATQQLGGLGQALLSARQMQHDEARWQQQQAAQEASQGRLFQQQTQLEQMREAAQTRAQAASEQRSRLMAEEAYRRALALAEKKGELKPDRPLTESQGQAAMFLKQGENALNQAMQMGPGIFPTPGVAGGLESLAWKARIAGFPQLSSSEQQARQGLLLSIAEPIIRAESGAAVPESEVRRLATRYIPMPGESAQEHQRKLKLLVNAIEAVSQKLPEAKAAEFRPFYEKAAAWASSYGAKPGQPSAPAEKTKPRKRYNPQTGEFE